MEFIAWSIAGILALFFTAHYGGYMRNIRSDEFFSPFHFVAGILLTFLFYGLTKSFLVSVLGTLVVGIAWEIHEYLTWKFILKRKKYKPGTVDTRNDLVLDFAGSLLAVALIAGGAVGI